MKEQNIESEDYKLPPIVSFERWNFLEYEPLNGKLKIKESGGEQDEYRA